MLTFDATLHKYYWNGKEKPSVTQILGAIGITRSYEGVDQFYRDRGTLVHQAIHYDIKGTLDEDSVDKENVLPYLEGFRRFRAGHPYFPLISEVSLYSEEFGFAGTIDQIGRIDPSDGPGLVDTKITESSDKAADLQLCMYAQLYFENYQHWPSFRMALELHGDGSAKPIFYKTDPIICKALMEIYRWKTTRRSPSINAKP